jgi:PleD family two-component response regulator
VTAKRASDALSIVREKEDDLNLVLTEAHLPDMDKYEFLERMGEISKLPVVSKYHSRFSFFSSFFYNKMFSMGWFLLSDSDVFYS